MRWLVLLVLALAVMTAGMLSASLLDFEPGAYAAVAILFVLSLSWLAAGLPGGGWFGNGGDG